MRLFKTFIVIGLVLMGTGVAIALPSSASIDQIFLGAAVCWMSLPFFWFAAKVQPR